MRHVKVVQWYKLDQILSCLPSAIQRQHPLKAWIRDSLSHPEPRLKDIPAQPPQIKASVSQAHILCRHSRISFDSGFCIVFSCFTGKLTQLRSPTAVFATQSICTYYLWYMWYINYIYTYISPDAMLFLFFQAAGWSNLARPLPDPRNPAQLHWNLEILLEPCGE